MPTTFWWPNLKSLSTFSNDIRIRKESLDLEYCITLSTNGGHVMRLERYFPIGFDYGTFNVLSTYSSKVHEKALNKIPENLRFV